MNLSERLSDIAALSLEAGQPSIFKRLIRASVVVADHDTDEELSDSLEEDVSDDYVDDDTAPEDEDDDEDEDEDIEGFAGMPMGALPYKERRRGPYRKDVGVGKVDWWNP